MPKGDWPTGRWQVSATHRADYDYGTKEYTHHLDQPQSVSATFTTETPEEAHAIAAQYPKGAKVRGGTFSTYEENNPNKRIDMGSVHFQAGLAPTGVNKGVNETGMKRYRQMRKAAEKLGHPVEWKGEGVRNYYPDEASFEEHVKNLFNDRRKQ